MLTAFDFDECWETGEYEDQLCDICPYREDCQGEERDNEHN